MTLSLGIAFVGPDYQVDNGSGVGQVFADGILSLQGFNASRVKIFASSRYATNDYALHSWKTTPGSLVEFMQDSDIDNFIGQFDEILINAFTWSGLSVAGVDPWRSEDGTYNARVANEYTEIKAAAEHLLTTYSGKRFIFSQHEGDWAMVAGTDAGAFIPPRRPAYMLGMLRARQNAVNDARKAVNSTSTIENAVEVNLLYDRRNNKTTRHMIRSVLGQIMPDVVSYSCYDSITPAADPWRASQAAMLADITERLNASLDLIGDACPSSRVIIGECGLPENEIPVGYSSAAIIDHIYETINDHGLVETMYMWNCWDNEDPRGYYLQDSGGAVGPVGDWVSNKLGGSL